MESRISTAAIKKFLLDYHKTMGHQIFDSFPILSDDPTLLFTNATVTPFKGMFTGKGLDPTDFAMIQRCLRLGGASELDEVGVNPYYHTFFEMFGSGLFGLSHGDAIKYVLDLLSSLGLDVQRMYFTIPDDEFRAGLEKNQIDPQRVFFLEKNHDLFWGHWHFGRLGPVGRGLTIIYNNSDNPPTSLDQMACNSDDFVELLTLIYIYGQESESGEIVKAINPGFDMAVGVERLAAVIQQKNQYEIDSIEPLVKHFTNSDVDLVSARVCADHMRAICVLVEEGVLPANKGAGYVLKKLTNRVVETLWSSIGEPFDVEKLVLGFCDILMLTTPEVVVNCDEVANLFKQRSTALLTAMEKGKRILEQNPDISSEILMSTYGVSPTMYDLMVNRMDQT